MAPAHHVEPLHQTTQIGMCSLKIAQRNLSPTVSVDFQAMLARMQFGELQIVFRRSRTLTNHAF